MKTKNAVIAAAIAVVLGSTFFAYASQPSGIDPKAGDDSIHIQIDTSVDPAASQTDDNCFMARVTWTASDADLSNRMNDDLLINPVQDVVIRGIPVADIDGCNQNKNPGVANTLTLPGGDVAVSNFMTADHVAMIRLPKSGGKVLVYVSRCFAPDFVARFQKISILSGDEDIGLEQVYAGVPDKGECAR